MFLRTTKAKNNNYVSIVKAYRASDGKPKQKVVKNLGAFKTEDERKKLYILGKSIIKTMQGHVLLTHDNIKELRRENWGAAAVFDRLFEVYKLDQFITKLLKHRKIEYELTAALKFMIATRHCEPMSKLASFNKRHNFSGFASLDLQHLYRSLDELHRYQDEIKKHMFNRQKALFSNKIDVVFFDVTTLYFESQKSDDLRNFGFSKDCKFNEVQIVLSLLIASDGRPIGYEIFPGNQYEGNTLIHCLERLRECYKLDKVIIVADRGLSSFDNLQAIKERGFEYIVASRLGNLPMLEQNKILDGSEYQVLYEGEDVVRYKTICFERTKRYKNGIDKVEKAVLSDNLLCLYSSKRAQKDAKDRQRLVQKAEEMIRLGSCHNKRGAKKYLKMEQKKVSGLDIEKIREAERYDGFYVISYSDVGLSPRTVAGTYSGLWKIEASFRSMKNFFEARPMFHWTEERISGHIMLNFICLIFEHYIEEAVRKEVGISEQLIRGALSGLERSVLDINGVESFIYAPITDIQSMLLKVLNVKRPT